METDQTSRNAIYSVDALIEQARQLAADFRRATGQMLPISGEIARFDAAKQLGLQLLDKPVNGVDAVGGGINYQIKGRVILDEDKSGHRIGQINPEGDWDAMILTLMNANFQPYEIHVAERQELLDALTKVSENRRKRGALSVARFKIIGHLAWTKEDGLEPDIWSNP